MSAPRLVRPLLLVVVPVVLLVPLAACGAGDGEEAEASSTTAAAPSEPTTAVAVHATTVTTEAPAPTTTEPPTEEEAILAAVDGFWQTIVASSQPPDPEHPGLEQFLTGEQLETTVDQVVHRQTLGQALKASPQNLARQNSRVTNIDGDSATVYTCELDDLVLYDVASGRTLNDAVATREWTLTLTRDQSWRVSESVIETQVDGVSGCAAE